MGWVVEGRRVVWRGRYEFRKKKKFGFKDGRTKKKK
jgi:hypothetical protein